MKKNTTIDEKEERLRPLHITETFSALNYAEALEDSVNSQIRYDDIEPSINEIHALRVIQCW